MATAMRSVSDGGATVQVDDAPLAQCPQALSTAVVVAAFNEEQHIERLIRSLANQDAPPNEVIVVDDGSSDSTAARAERAGACVVRTAHRGAAAARNAGAELATGDILVFLDGDMECGPGFLRRLIAPIAEDGVVGTFTREIFIANTDNRWARAYAALRWSPPDRVLPADFPDRWGAFRAIRRDAFERVGGFDDVGYGEDMTLASKLGEQARVARGAVCFHHHPSSLGEVFENGRWVGRGAAIRALRHPWWTHSPPRVLVLGIRQVLGGRTPWLLPARIAYHAGVLAGLVQSRRHPERHWK
jgi:glycosyltransferase involved in cell wall biosynthesis